jgi:hypothetical protein
LKKKILVILFCSFFSLISCESDTISIYQPNFTEDKIDFPFTEIDDGRFVTIYRNNTEDNISYSLIMVSQGNLIAQSQDQDYCEGVTALRNSKDVKEWIPINFNYSAISENSILNKNDHPNQISYSLPKGTYLLMLQDSKICNRDNHVIFDVKRNKAFETSK